jgi:hypothetical protein
VLAAEHDAFHVAVIDHEQSSRCQKQEVDVQLPAAAVGNEDVAQRRGGDSLERPDELAARTVAVPAAPAGYGDAQEVYERYVAENGSSWLIDGRISRPIDFALHNAYRGVPDSLNPLNYDASREGHFAISKTGLNYDPIDIPVTVRYLEDKDYRKEVECKAKLRTLVKRAAS